MRKSIVIIAMSVSICCAQTVQAPHPKKIYIEEFVSEIPALSSIAAAGIAPESEP
jgi:hypothetical protein